MDDYEINDVGAVGLVQDLPAHTILPEAWTLLSNMRCFDGKLSKLAGHQEVFASPSQAPRFIMPVVNPAQVWWLYASASKLWVWDGTAHTDMSRSVGGAYSSASPYQYNGTILGGIPIINNGLDVPQYWAAYATGTKFANLSNWTSTHRCKAIKAFGPFLVAVNITKSGATSPHMVKWSHPADPGALPISWDHTDQALDAGEVELPDSNTGMLLNCGTLRGQMFLYKEQAIWRMRLIGGQGIFSFEPFVESAGMISPRGFAYTPDGLKHVVMTSDDVVVHDGQSMQSILTNRVRRELFDKRLDRNNVNKCFLFTNPKYREVWICYPEATGTDEVSRALIWNQESNIISGEAILQMACADTGFVEAATPGAWDDFSSTTWQETELTWNQRASRSVVMADGSSTKFFELDVGGERDGKKYRARAQRTNLAIMGKKRDGSPIQDYKRMKMYRRVWLKASGGVFSVRVGVQQQIDGPVVWKEWQTFDPATDQWVDAIMSGRALAIEFASSSSDLWQVHGYKPEVVPLGNF